jgi:hypothetical protein
MLKLIFFVTLLWTITTSIASADRLTPAQIQHMWAEQSDSSGSFVVQYGDGSVDQGTFTLSPTKALVMTYLQSDARVTMHSKGVLIEDINYPQNNQNQSDNRLGAIFNPEPSFAGYVKTSGTDADRTYTMLRFKDTDGMLEVFFMNATGKLSFLVTHSAEGKTTTRFTYNNN